MVGLLERVGKYERFHSRHFLAGGNHWFECFASDKNRVKLRKNFSKVDNRVDDDPIDFTIGSTMYPSRLAATEYIIRFIYS